MNEKYLEELIAKTFEGIAQLRESQSKTDAQLAKTDAQLAKTDAQLARTDAKLDKISQMVGNIGNNQGDVAEEFFWNSISSNPVIGGIKYDSSEKNRHKKVGNIEDEYDILMVNGKDIAIIETKYKAHENDVIKLINKKYENFKKLYSEYKDYNHHLGLASFYISDDVKEMALDNNVMILQRKGDIIETTLPPHK